MFSTFKLVFLFISACSACRGRTGKSPPTYSNQVVQDISFKTHTIVQLKGDLVPRTLDSYDYKNTKGIRNVISDFIKRSERLLPSDRQHVHNMMVLNGSADYVYQGPGDNGFLSVIYEAYNNHWAVKTVPDDWWYTIIRTVAIAIDNNSKKNETRDFFVNFEGKKTLTVMVDRSNGIDYNRFFHLMTNLVQSNIKVEGYVDTIRSDFTTSTSVHRISSEITIMSSMQEYFEYAMSFLCGIPYVELVGTERDWIQLKQKFLKLKSLLKPIENHIELADWWERIEVILDKLIDSYRGNADINWWTNIFRYTEQDSYGSGGPDYDFDGWFLKDLLNIKRAFITSLGEVPSGLVSVPLKFILEDGSEVKGALSSGIAGIKLDQSKNPPVVEATHGWAIFAERYLRI